MLKSLFFVTVLAFFNFSCSYNLANHNKQSGLNKKNITISYNSKVPKDFIDFVSRASAKTNLNVVKSTDDLSSLLSIDLDWSRNNLSYKRNSGSFVVTLFVVAKYSKRTKSNSKKYLASRLLTLKQENWKLFFISGQEYNIRSSLFDYNADKADFMNTAYRTLFAQLQNKLEKFSLETNNLKITDLPDLQK